MGGRNLRIDIDRLMSRIEALGRIGAIDGGGVCRLALTDADKMGRDLVVGWMRELGLTVSVDPVGNVVGIRPGLEDGPPVMTGSHIDTVRTGGYYDGNLGVLAGLEVIACLNDAGIRTRRPVAVAFFTNEEGARFQPDMLGSLAFVGGLPLAEALGTRAIDGAILSEDLARIGYAGLAPIGRPVHAFVELHVEQGPVLEAEGFAIGAVEGVQGISWTELVFEGQSNHAGTTPMRLRHDAGYVACAVASFVRDLTKDMGAEQVGTVGRIEMSPNLVNVIAAKATMTVDLRNTNEGKLQDAERRLFSFVERTAAAEGISVARRTLARFGPVAFDPALIERVDAIARELGHSVKRLPSGAGHDAQMLARVCPTTMIFVPSRGGISHNVREYTAPGQIAAGADILLSLLLELAA